MNTPYHLNIQEYRFQIRRQISNRVMLEIVNELVI